MGTRAWNFFSALYYKAGGFPWRIPRRETDYQTCFIGIAFLQSPDKKQMHTSIAQVFNERGHGITIQGRDAKVSEADLQPHISPEDVADLVARCIKPVFYTLPKRDVDNQRLTTAKKSLALHFGAVGFRGFLEGPEAWPPRRRGWPARRGL
jgi:hypothetical protein